MKYAPDSLYQTLAAARKKPELLVERRNLSLLQCFINGYLCSMEDNQLRNEEMNWYDAFVSYANDRYNPSGYNHNLEHIILAQGYNQETGVDFFFQILSDFAQQYMMPSCIHEENFRVYREIHCTRLSVSAISSLLSMQARGNSISKDSCTEYIWADDFKTVTILRFHPEDFQKGELNKMVHNPIVQSLPIHNEIFGQHIPFHTFVL